MNVVKGAIGLSKCAAHRAKLHVDEAAEPTRLGRVEVCRACPRSKKRNGKLTTWSTCSACDCLIVCKTAIASEACPESRWPALDSGG